MNDDLDNKLNQWFGLDEDWMRTSEISSSFFSSMRKERKKIDALCRKRDKETDLIEKNKLVIKIEKKRNQYHSRLEQGPSFDIV